MTAAAGVVYSPWLERRVCGTVYPAWYDYDGMTTWAHLQCMNDHWHDVGVTQCNRIRFAFSKKWRPGSHRMTQDGISASFWSFAGEDKTVSMCTRMGIVMRDAAEEWEQKHVYITVERA